MFKSKVLIFYYPKLWKLKFTGSNSIQTNNYRIKLNLILKFIHIRLKITKLINN